MDQKLLVGIDCSNCSNRALDYAGEWALAAGAELTIVHVIEWSPYSFNTPMENEKRHQRREEELARAHAEIIDPLVQQMKDKGVNVEGVIRHGHAAQTIAALAEEIGATNIIIGRKGTSRLKAQIFGSVPSMLVQIAEKPVTVVP